MNESTEVVARIISTLEQLRTSVQADGGDITFVQLAGHEVHVKLHGACINCPMSFYTLKMGVEEALKKIDDRLVVVAIEEK